MSRRQMPVLISFFFALSLSSPAFAAAWTWNYEIYPGVDYATRPHVSGKTNIHLVRIDNNYVGVTIRPFVTADSSPRKGQETSTFARAKGLQIAINAGFYNTTTFDPSSIVVSNGSQWANTYDSGTYGQFGYTADGRPKYIEEAPIASKAQYPWMHNVVSGTPVIVQKGAVVANLHSSAACAGLGHCNSYRARTGVGLSADNRYTYLVTVEENPSKNGMTMNQFAALMVEVGAHWALNLDGGGSTTMHIEAKGGRVGRVQGSSSYQRPVSNHLGFYVQSTRPDYICKQAAVDNPSSVFQDIVQGSWQEPIANAIYEAGITNGCSASPLLFCPNCELKRAHAAVFLGRALNLTPYDNPTPTFTDVPRTDPNYGVIEALVRARIVAGCTATTFCPDALLTRSAAAALIARAYDLKPERYADSTPSFDDVAADNWAFTFIEALKHNCVTSGCGTDVYCPNKNITRIEFVAFIARMMAIGSQANCYDENPVNQAPTPDPEPGEPEDPSAPLDPEPLDPPQPWQPDEPEIPEVPDAGALPDVGTPFGPDLPADPSISPDASLGAEGVEPDVAGNRGVPPTSSCGVTGSGAGSSAAPPPIAAALTLLWFALAVLPRRRG